MSNNMPLEARVAERIKNSELGQFFTDDDLTDIVRRAIQEAFFKPRPDPKTANSYHYQDRKELPPLVVEVAIATFKEKFAALAGPMVEELFAMPEFREQAAKTIFSTIARHGDAVLEEKVQRGVYDMFMNNSNGLLDIIVNAVRNKQ